MLIEDLVRLGETDVLTSRVDSQATTYSCI